MGIRDFFRRFRLPNLRLGPRVAFKDSHSTVMAAGGIASGRDVNPIVGTTTRKNVLDKWWS